MTQPDKPSDKFGIRRDNGGLVRVEFYRPDGVAKSRVTFDQAGAAEFAHALLGVVLGVDGEQ